MFEGDCAQSDALSILGFILFVASEFLGSTQKVQPNTVLGALKAGVMRIARRRATAAAEEPEDEEPPEPPAPTPLRRGSEVQAAIGPHNIDIQMTQGGTRFFLENLGNGGGESREASPPQQRRPSIRLGAAEHRPPERPEHPRQQLGLPMASSDLRAKEAAGTAAEDAGGDGD